jgi:hypothetical protein
MGGARPVEPAAVLHAAQHADHEPGPGASGAQDAALAGRDHGHVPHVADAEPQDRRQHQVGPGKAPGHVVGAQDQVATLPPAQPFHDQAERGPRQAGHQAQLRTRRGQLGQRVVRAGQRERPEPVEGGRERPLEGEVRGLGPDIVLGKQDVHDLARGPAPGPVELNHRPDVGCGARHHALSRDRLDERPLQHAAVNGGRTDHVTADQRYRGGIAHRRAQSSSMAVASFHRSSSARSA